MESKTLIASLCILAILVAVVAVFIATDKGEKDPEEPKLEGEWNLVSVYTGSWNGDTPQYNEDTKQKESVRIYPSSDGFYVFDNGKCEVYCSWTGKYLVASGLDGSPGIGFVTQLPKNGNFAIAFHFSDAEAIIKLYQRQGYVGDFPGLEIPIDIPKAGETLESFKNKEYTDDETIDHDPITFTMRAINGRMIFYEAPLDDMPYKFVGMYIDGNIFTSLGVCGDLRIQDMSEYRKGVLYSASRDYENGSTRVTEYGDGSSKEYPTIDLEGCVYDGLEDYLITKDGRIIERADDNKLTLDVEEQDDEYVRMYVADEKGMAISFWQGKFNFEGPVNLGVSTQSSVNYKGVDYRGEYYGCFTKYDLSEFSIYGMLSGSDGSQIVISQTYTLSKG